MPRITTITCDCGCGEKIEMEGAISLEQELFFPGNPAKRNSIKLRCPVYFKDIFHLHKWTNKALLALPALVEQAESLSPRSDISNDDVAGLYI